MQNVRRLTRRSFLARVAGAGLLAGAGLIPGAAGQAEAPKGRRPSRRMAVDADPSDPARRPAPPAQPRPADTDSGPNSDPGGTGSRIGRTAPRERFVICPRHVRCPR